MHCAVTDIMMYRDDQEANDILSANMCYFRMSCPLILAESNNRTIIKCFVVFYGDLIGKVVLFLRGAPPFVCVFYEYFWSSYHLMYICYLYTIIQILNFLYLCLLYLQMYNCKNFYTKMYYNCHKLL